MKKLILIILTLTIVYTTSVYGATISFTIPDYRNNLVQ